VAGGAWCAGKPGRRQIHDRRTTDDTEPQTTVIPALIVWHALVALVAPALAGRLGRRVFLWCALAPAVTLVWLAGAAGGVVDGRPVTASIDWVPALGLELSFRVDGFGLLMAGVVAGIGLLVFAYAASYFAGHEHPKLGALGAHLAGFAGSMLGLVTADNVFALFVFWELTAVFSFLLIGFDDTKGSARGAAREALLVTSLGGLALLGGLVLLSQAAGTTSLAGILAAPPQGATVTAALVLVVIGAATKSAQVPFHFWLPAAMEAPTPVSAYLHSATMVKAGVYLVARFSPAFGSTALWRPLVVGIGLATMVVGGYRALRQHDLKLLLAFGTVSQLGFLFVVFGAGTPTAAKAGAAVLLAHALFKAALFLVTGIIDHQAHTRDLRRLDGLGRHHPALAATGVAAAASMAGIPLCFGFVAKELALEAWVEGPFAAPGDAAVLAVVVLGSMLTVAYSARFVWGAFAGKAAVPGARAAGADVPPAAPAFLAPALVLAAAGVLLGVVPGLAGTLVVDAAAALVPRAPGSLAGATLKLWHGLTPALGVSALVLAGGAALVAARRRVERFQTEAPSPGGAAIGYQRSLELLNRIADLTTGVLQNGSLPTYVAVVATSLVVVPGAVLIPQLRAPDGLVLAESWVQLLVVVLIGLVVAAAARIHRRFAAVLLVGAAGFLVAGLFVIQGGADLALTLVLIETLAIVIFVLVLRHLPERFRAPVGRGVVAARAAVALAAGAFVTGFLLTAGAARTAAPVGEELVGRALPDGGGRNVVNVILTDFRALDTLGEIAVLLVAALGISALVTAGRRARGPAPGVGPGAVPGPGPGPGAGPPDRGRDAPEAEINPVPATGAGEGRR
jgi:multicomponent Na+:H+ antiporter subunit A